MFVIRRLSDCKKGSPCEVKVIYKIELDLPFQAQWIKTIYKIKAGDTLSWLVTLSQSVKILCILPLLVHHNEASLNLDGF